jgi:uncharacterized protein YfaP (DUF2135 family)
LSEGRSAFIASPEKALLDLVILTPQGDTPAYLDELRLQNLKILDLDKMKAIISRMNKPKLERFFVYFEQLYHEQLREEKVL